MTAYQEHIGWIGEKASLCFRQLTFRREAWSPVKADASPQHELSLTGLARQSGEKRLASPAIICTPIAAYLVNPMFTGMRSRQSRSIGEHQVYDLSVPDGSNFIAQDICVHNTSLCLTLAQNAAIQGQAVVGVFSLEMSEESLVMRMLCSEGRVDAHRFRSGFLSREEWARLAQALGSLADAKIFIDDTPGITVLEMRAKARRLASEQKKLDLIIVDYMQLMSGSSRRSESRQQEVSQISRELKGLAEGIEHSSDRPFAVVSRARGRTDHRPPVGGFERMYCRRFPDHQSVYRMQARKSLSSSNFKSPFRSIRSTVIWSSLKP
ncbi:MAG: DnaB-like helicase C-terminal domain-containing protein [Pyrinomonadaceae bacterium]